MKKPQPPAWLYYKLVLAYRMASHAHYQTLFQQDNVPVLDDLQTLLSDLCERYRPNTEPRKDHADYLERIYKEFNQSTNPFKCDSTRQNASGSPQTSRA